MRCLVAAVALAVSVAAGASPFGHVDAQGPNRAGIVVSFGDTTSGACVEFDEPEISGAELLSRAGFAVVAAGGGMGAAVCMIDGVGCADPNDCWCQCHGATCRYWAYFTLEEGGWRYSAIGASQRKVHDGDVDGWTWGLGAIGSAAKPGPITFEELCPEEAPPPSVTPPPAAPTMPQAAPTETVVDAATATSPPPTATVAGQTPPATATKPRPTSFPIGHLPTEVADTTKEDGGSSFPWQVPAFAALAVGLLGTAVVLARRRSGG
jgi:hypothetical protein